MMVTGRGALSAGNAWAAEVTAKGWTVDGKIKASLNRRWRVVQSSLGTREQFRRARPVSSVVAAVASCDGTSYPGADQARSPDVCSLMLWRRLNDRCQSAQHLDNFDTQKRAVHTQAVLGKSLEPPFHPVIPRNLRLERER